MDLSKQKFGTPHYIYGLFVVGCFIPVAAIAGMIWSYVVEPQGDMEKSHFEHLKATFWGALIMAVAAFLTKFIFIGYLFIPLALVWSLSRLVTGGMLLMNGESISRTECYGLWAK